MLACWPPPPRLQGGGGSSKSNHPTHTILTIYEIFNNTYFGNDQPYFFSSRDKMLMSKFNTQILLSKKLESPKMVKFVVFGTTAVMGVIRPIERNYYG